MARTDCAAAVMLIVGAAHAFVALGADTQTATPLPAGRHRIEVLSTLDGSLQPSYIVVPTSGAQTSTRRPLAVILHTWGYDLEQRFDLVEAETEARGWLLLEPNFRGRSDHPGACGSPLAQQDILDAVGWVRSHHAVDEKRIYVLGWSGGGFMTMLMAARYPQTWAAASAGAGISDLRAWYTERRSDEIGAQLRGCFGGAPTSSEKLASQYRDQSPLTYLRPGLGVPLDLAAGKDDPQVSVRHTLRAFRALAPGALSEAEIESLLSGSDRQHQSGSGSENDPLIPRRIFLRRTAGQVRLTIFDGQHDWFHKAAIEWLAQHHRP